MKKFSSCIGVAVFFALTAVVTAEETIEQVEKNLAAAVEKLQSLSCKMNSVTDMKMEGMTNKSEYSGTMEFMKKDGKNLMRSELTGTNVSNYGGQEMKQEMKATSVADGEYVYTVTEMMGQKQAMKMKMDPAQDSMNVKATFDSLREDHNLKVLPDEKVDGKDTYVIEATPKETQGAQISKMVLNFSKELGMSVKTAVFAADGTPMSTTTLTDIKTNPALDASKFVFTAPEGVTVQDMSNMQMPEGHP